jgi:hypothetical protein
LYRAKHEVELMDKHIEQIARETSDIRAESRRLLDDWIRLGEPEQLHRYSDEYLGLQTIAPTQFARLSDLPGRLPAPRADPPAEDPAAIAQSGDPVDPSGSAQAAGMTTDGTDEANADDLPVPPIPPANPGLIAVSLPGVSAIPLQARPVTPRVVGNPADPGPRAAENREADDPRAVTPRPPAAAVAEPRVTAAQTTSRDRAPSPSQARAGVGSEAPVQPEQSQAARNQAEEVNQAQTGGLAAGQHPGPQNGGPLPTGQAAPTQASQPGQPPARSRQPENIQFGNAQKSPALRPIQAPGLPPLQAQGAAREPAQNPPEQNLAGQYPVGQYPARQYPERQFSAAQTAAAQTSVGRPVPALPAQNHSAQPLGRAIPWTSEARETERPADTRREYRPASPAYTEPRMPARQVAQQTPAPMSPQSGQPQFGQLAQPRSGQPQSGSLLGMSRGTVPLPVPAPMPVSATWPGAGR